MNLLGSIVKLQKIGIQFYLELSHSFEHNELMNANWLALARDIEHQAESLKALPHSFWKDLEIIEDTHLTAAPACLAGKPHEAERNKSLAICFSRMLDFEEPLILKVYVPIIRRLRTAWANQALDFYIMVKAHVARLARMVGPFSIEPNLVRRSMILLEQFEKEVQTPHLPVSAAVAGRSQQAAGNHGSHSVVAGTQGTEPEKHKQEKMDHSPISRTKSLSKRTPPLMSKIEVSRRRASR